MRPAASSGLARNHGSGPMPTPLRSLRAERRSRCWPHGPAPRPAFSRCSSPTSARRTTTPRSTLAPSSSATAWSCSRIGNTSCGPHRGRRVVDRYERQSRPVCSCSASRCSLRDRVNQPIRLSGTERSLHIDDEARRTETTYLERAVCEKDVPRACGRRMARDLEACPETQKAPA